MSSLDDNQACGTIRSFDGADGLGWIDLDDGREVRFGLTACKDVSPTPGSRVRIDGLRELRGTLRAQRVEPLLEEWDDAQLVWPEAAQEFGVERRWEDDAEVERRVRYTSFDRDACRRESPRWPAADRFADFAITPMTPQQWEHIDAPSPHPFFEPWHDGIVATAIGCVHLTDEEPSGNPRARVGGTTACIESSWPVCTRGHGPMTLLVEIDAAAFAGLVDDPKSLSVHTCVECLNEDHHVQLGDPSAAAVVSWTANGSPQTADNESPCVLPEVSLWASLTKSYPPCWISQPRKDVSGHVPVDGVQSRLFEVKLRREGMAGSSPYEDSTFAFEQNYADTPNGIILGGYPVFRFALCPACGKPMQQLLYLSDYFTDGAFEDLFEGSNELTLLTCTRTPACGGPEGGLLILDP